MNINYTYLAIFNHSNEKIQISFPDFPGLSETANNDEEAVKAAKKALTGKLEALKKDSIEFPKPKQISDLTTADKEVVMPVTINLGMAILKDGISNLSSSKMLENEQLNSSLNKVADIFGNPANKFIEEKKLTHINPFIGIFGAVLYILSVFFPLVSIGNMYFRIKATLFTAVNMASSFGVSAGFWGYLAYLIGILIIVSGVLSAYASHIKNINLLKLSILANISLFILALITAIIAIAKSQGVASISWSWFTFILSIIIMLTGYSILSKKKK